jgi:hypothetical protein
MDSMDERSTIHNNSSSNKKGLHVDIPTIQVNAIKLFKKNVTLNSV